MKAENVTRRRVLSLSAKATVGLGLGGSVLSGCFIDSSTRAQRTLDIPAGDITALLPMGGSLIAGDDQGSIYIWDTISWNLTQSDRDSPYESGLVNSIYPLGADSVLVSQRSLNVYDIKSAALKRTVYKEKTGSTADETDELAKQDSAASVILSDGRMLDGTEGGVIRIWDSSGFRTAELGDGIMYGHVARLAVNHAGTKLAAGFIDYDHAGPPGSTAPTAILVWDLRTMKVDRVYKDCGASLLFDSSDRLMYPAETGLALDPAPAQFKQHAAGWVGAYNAARNIVALGSRMQVSVVDGTTGKELKKIVGSDSEYYTSLAILDDGRTLACGMQDGYVKIYDI